MGGGMGGTGGRDGYENWMNSYGAMSNILLWAQSDQTIILGSRRPENLNFPYNLV